MVTTYPVQRLQATAALRRVSRARFENLLATPRQHLDRAPHHRERGHEDGALGVDAPGDEVAAPVVVSGGEEAGQAGHEGEEEVVRDEEDGRHVSAVLRESPEARTHLSRTKERSN